MPRKRFKARVRLKALAWYILQAYWAKQQPVTFLQVQALCYLVDIEYYRKYGRSLTGAVYTTQAEGPRPADRRYVVNAIRRHVCAMQEQE